MWEVTHGGVACPKVGSHEPSTNSTDQNNSIKNDVNVKIDAQKLCSSSHAELIELLQTVLSRNDELETQVGNVRAHLLSVEKIMFDEIRAVKSIAESAKRSTK